jgi:hypothetical protein
MATLYSDGITIARLGRRTQPNQQRGKSDTLAWIFASLPAGNIGDLLVCAKLFKGDRVISGREQHSAMGGTATGAYGTYAVAADGITLGAVDSGARFLAATSHVAAGTTVIADTIALGAMFEAPTDLYVVCTNAASAFATAGVIQGHIVVLRG